jgi:hypothetical protein
MEKDIPRKWSLKAYFNLKSIRRCTEGYFIFDKGNKRGYNNCKHRALNVGIPNVIK